jgi:DNA-binding CsgD family transcriptional regulator
MTSTLSTVAAILAILLIPVLFIAWLIETPEERILRRAAAGWSQKAIADRMGITRHRVRKVLATA